MEVRVVALIGRVSSPTAPAAVLTKNAPTGLHTGTSTLELPLPRASQNLARDERLCEVLLLPSFFAPSSEDLRGPEGPDPCSDSSTRESPVGFVPPPLCVDRFALEVLPCSIDKLLRELGDRCELAPVVFVGAGGV